jgi:hypothetical protein
MPEQFTFGGLLFVRVSHYVGSDTADYDVYAPVEAGPLGDLKAVGIATSDQLDPDGPPLWYWRPNGWERGDDVKVFRSRLDLVKHIKETA